MEILVNDQLAQRLADAMRWHIVPGLIPHKADWLILVGQRTLRGFTEKSAAEYIRMWAQLTRDESIRRTSLVSILRTPSHPQHSEVSTWFTRADRTDDPLLRAAWQDPSLDWEPVDWTETELKRLAPTPWRVGETHAAVTHMLGAQHQH
jgi:hypothetical protein